MRDFKDRQLPRYSAERELEMHQFVRMVKAQSDQEVQEPVMLNGSRATVVTYYKEGRVIGLMVNGHPRRYIQVLNNQFKQSGEYDLVSL